MHQFSYFFNPRFLPRNFLKNTRKIKQIYPETAIENLSRANVFNFMKHVLGCFFLLEIYMFKFNIKNIRTSCEISSSCTQKHQNINFEHTFHFGHIYPCVFNIDFEHVNPAKNRSALKIVLLMRTDTRGVLTQTRNDLKPP